MSALQNVVAVVAAVVVVVVVVVVGEEKASSDMHLRVTVMAVDGAGRQSGPLAANCVEE